MKMTEEQAYELMCMDCPNAKHCHEECEVCDDFLEATDPDNLYECQSCGKKFDEPVMHRERCEDYGYEEVYGCPFCGGGYIQL